MKISLKIYVALLFIIVNISAIYGVDLKYISEAKTVKPHGVDIIFFNPILKQKYPKGGKFVTIWEFTKANEASITEYANAVKKGDGFAVPGNLNLSGGIGYLQTHTIVFNGPEKYNVPDSNIHRISNFNAVPQYEVDKEGSGIPFYYDSYYNIIDKKINVNLTNLSPKLGYVTHLPGGSNNVAAKSNNTVFGNNYVTFSFKSNEIIENKFKIVTIDGVQVVITEYYIEESLFLDKVKIYGENGISNEVLKTEGVRFSSIVATQAPSAQGSLRQNINTLQLWHTLIDDAKWDIEGWGFKNNIINPSFNNYTYNTIKKDPSILNNLYLPSASSANLFDNVMLIDVPPQEDSIMLINHLDVNTNKALPELSQGKRPVTRKSSLVYLDNLGPKHNFLELYYLKVKDVIEVYETKTYGYKFMYAQKGESTLTPNLQSSINEAKNKANSSAKTTNMPIKYDNEKGKKVIVINLYYESSQVKPPEEEEYRMDLKLIGKLAFINLNDARYTNATLTSDIDYAPIKGELTPYVEGAYPYVVRALKKTTLAMQQNGYIPQNTVTPTITFSKQFVYDGYYSSSKCKLVCETSTQYPICGNEEKPGGHQHSSTCFHEHGYWSCYDHSDCSVTKFYNRRSTVKEDFYYPMNYKNNYFYLTNLKVYMIKDLMVYDDTANVGGTLFEDSSSIQVKTSTTYNTKFSQGGHTSHGITFNYETKNNVWGFNKSGMEYSDSYNLYLPNQTTGETIYGTCNIPPLNEGDTSYYEARSNAEKELKGKIPGDNENEIARSTNFRTQVHYWNDGYSLPGFERNDNMLIVNKKWHEFTYDNGYNYVNGTNRPNQTRNKVFEFDSTTQGSTSSIIDYTKNVLTYMVPELKEDDKKGYVHFEPNYQKIPENRENGIRELRGEIRYEIIDTDVVDRVSNWKKHNIGTEDFVATDFTYKKNSNLNVSKQYFKSQKKEFKGRNDVNIINVLTPLSVAKLDFETEDIINHSTDDKVPTLQKDAIFTITPSVGSYNKIGYNFNSTLEYVGGSFYNFDFGAKFDSAGGTAYDKGGNVLRNGDLILNGSTIFVEGITPWVKASPTQEVGSTTAQQYENRIRAILITKSATERLKEHYRELTINDLRFIDSDSISVNYETNNQNQEGKLTRLDIFGDANHAIDKKITTTNIARVFDFAVTDCNDLAFKDVFRKPSGTNVNETTGVAYYGGYKKLDLTAGIFNNMIPRDESEIGKNPKTILPLGPYKHNSGQYLQAPKMGYRISFDLKTFGYIPNSNKDDTRHVEITPKFYYISKDGKTIDNNISLYYKEDSGKYVDFAGSNYTIYFTPNDGYRYLRNTAYADDYTTMSNKLEPIVVSPSKDGSYTTFKLDKKMMSSGNIGFIQAWYGEFKLPNSTIVFSKDKNKANNNINNPYTNGYLGVIFDIKVVDKNGFTVLYGSNNKDAAGNNTTQWDYEGYLNFKSPGEDISSSNSLFMQLEKGKYEIKNNDEYNKVKGTVVLFDLDNRAADDFQ